MRISASLLIANIITNTTIFLLLFSLTGRSNISLEDENILSQIFFKKEIATKKEKLSRMQILSFLCLRFVRKK